MVTRNFYRGPMEEGGEIRFDQSRGSTVDWTFPGNRPAYVTITAKGAKGNPGSAGQAAVVTKDAQPGERGTDGQPGTAGDGGDGGAGGAGNDGRRSPGGGGGGGGGAAGRSFVVYNWPLNDPNYANMSKFTNNPTGERFYNFKSPNSFGARGQGADNETYPIVQFSAAPFPGDNYHGPQNPPEIRLGNDGSSGSPGQVGVDGDYPGGTGGAGGLGRASVTSERSVSQGSGSPGQPGMATGGAEGTAQPGFSGQAGEPGTNGATGPAGAAGQLAEATGGAAGQPGNRGGSSVFQSITGPSIRYEFLGGDGGAAGVPTDTSIANAAQGGAGGLGGVGNPGEPGQAGNPGGSGNPGGTGVGGQGGTLGRVAASFERTISYDFQNARQTTDRVGFFPDNRGEGVVETISNNSANWSKTWMGNTSTSDISQQIHGRMGLGGMASYSNVGGQQIGGPGGQFDQVFVRERPNMTIPAGSNASDNHPAKGYLTRSGQPGGRLNYRTSTGSNAVIHRLGTPNPGFPATTHIFNPYYNPNEFRAVPGYGSVGVAVAPHEVHISVRRPLCSQLSTSFLDSIPGGLGGGDGKGGRGGDGGAGGSIPANKSLNMMTGQVGGAGGGGSSGSFATLGYDGSPGRDGIDGSRTLGQPGFSGQPASATAPGGLQPGQVGEPALATTEENVYVRAKQQFRVTLPVDDDNASFVTIRWSPH